MAFAEFLPRCGIELPIRFIILEHIELEFLDAWRIQEGVIHDSGAIGAWFGVLSSYYDKVLL